MRHVFLDPDGTTPIGLAVIVQHPTGVTYATQCNGTVTEERSCEGYLVLCPTHEPDAPEADLGKEMERFFYRHFRNGSWTTWTDILAEELAAIVARIPFWYDVDGESHRGRLELDRTRLADCVEAWVPVITPMGPGILVSDNSD